MALIIFDLDGTLVDSVDGIAFSMDAVLKELGYPTHSIEVYKSFVGNGIRKLVELALPMDIKAEIVDKAFEMMLERYQEHYDHNIRVYDGIYTVLDQLVQKGHRFAMVTNKHQSMAEPIMSKYFGDYPFERVVGRSEVNPKKPDPSSVNKIITELNFHKKDVYFVGDSEVDLMTARNAEVNDVVVTWGFRDKEDLGQLKPNKMIDGPMELLAYL